MPAGESAAVKKSCSGASAASSTTDVSVLMAGLFAPGTVSNSKAAVNCDPKNCDPAKCDVSKCDLTKCKPASCAGKGEKAAAIRL